MCVSFVAWAIMYIMTRTRDAMFWPGPPRNTYYYLMDINKWFAYLESGIMVVCWNFTTM